MRPHPIRPAAAVTLGRLSSPPIPPTPPAPPTPGRDTALREQAPHPLDRAGGTSLLRNALLVADHNAYHLGQVIMPRRALGAWRDG